MDFALDLLFVSALWVELDFSPVNIFLAVFCFLGSTTLLSVNSSSPLFCGFTSIGAESNFLRLTPLRVSFFSTLGLCLLSIVRKGTLVGRKFSADSVWERNRLNAIEQRRLLNLNLAVVLYSRPASFGKSADDVCHWFRHFTWLLIDWSTTFGQCYRIILTEKCSGRRLISTNNLVSN